MIKIKQKTLVSGFYVTLFLLLFFLPLPVTAEFNSDSHANIGIQLKLGNLALSPEKDSIISGIEYSGTKASPLSTSSLKNKGTLVGKVAYKIILKDRATGKPLADTNNIQISLQSNYNDKTGWSNNQDNTLTNKDEYSFFKDNNGNDVILEPKNKNQLPFKMEMKSSIEPEKTMNLEVTVKILLVQADATRALETNFYDTVTFKHYVKWTKEKEEKPEIEIPDNWPGEDGNWKVHDHVRYNDSQFKKHMYFSEVELSDAGKIEEIRNLNDNILYLELPEGELKEDNSFRISVTGGLTITPEVMKDRRSIKLTFSFDKDAEEGTNLLQESNYYTVSFNYGENRDKSVNFEYNLLPLLNKRLLVSTDKVNTDSYSLESIETTLQPKRINFSTIEDLVNESISSPSTNKLNDVSDEFSFTKLTTMITKNKDYFTLSSYQKANEVDKKGSFTIATKNTVDTDKQTYKGKFKLTLEGTSRYKLVIFRELITLKEENSLINKKPLLLDVLASLSIKESVNEKSKDSTELTNEILLQESNEEDLESDESKEGSTFAYKEEQIVDESNFLENVPTGEKTTEEEAGNKEKTSPVEKPIAPNKALDDTLNEPLNE